MTNDKDSEDALTIAYLLGVKHGRAEQNTQTDALKIARERITEWCDAVAVEWGQGSQTHNVARDGRDIVLAALRQPQTDAHKRTPMWTEAATIQTNGHWDGKTAQTDALKIAREALEAAPLIGATESAESFKARQDAWLNGQYRAALKETT
jgi:hypothetical protein